MDWRVITDDAEIGFTWADNGQFCFLRHPDGDMRKVPEQLVDILESIAAGERDLADVDDRTAAYIRELIADGYIYDGDAVKLEQSSSVSLLPRVIAFAVLLAVTVYVGLTSAVNLYGLIWSGAEIDTWMLAGGIAAAMTLLPIHEYAHYAAARRHVSTSMGVGTVNLIVPVALTNITQTWILDRETRIWVNIAGPTLHMLIALPLFVAAYAGVGGVFVEIVSAVVAGQIMFSLNPLYHGDGYQIVMDVCNTPNIRTRAMDDLEAGRPTLFALYGVLSYGYTAVVAAFSLLTAWLLFRSLVPIAALCLLYIGLAYADISERRSKRLVSHTADWELAVDDTIDGPLDPATLGE